MGKKSGVYIGYDKDGKLYLSTKIESIYDDKYKYIFKTNPGVIPIIGPNGTGKTTFIRNLLENLKDNDKVDLIHYDGLKDNGSMKLSKIAYHGSKNESYAEAIASRICGSEGQRRIPDIGNLFENIGGCIRRTLITDKIPVILIDGIETGLSINYLELINTILDTAADDNPKAFIFVATNAYELVAERECYNARNGKRKMFKSHTAYYNYILKTADDLEKKKW